MTSERTILLFVLWESARGAKEPDILADLAAHFTILKQFEILWTAREWERHLQTFYGMVSPVWQIKALRNGSGAFRVVVVEDTAPRWDQRADMRGRTDTVDLNAWEAKRRYRKLVGIKDAVHSSVNVRETRQNLAMLLDETLDDFLSRPDLDGGLQAVRALPPAEKGWRDIDHFFHIMNECSPYVVLRNARALRDEAAKGLHGDIDLLVANVNEFTAFAGAVKVKSKARHGGYLVSINRTPVRFDLRTPGDGYYDEKWARDILATRRLADGVYVPSEAEGEWSLLYHALAHKSSVAPDYLAHFGGEAGVSARKAELAGWMAAHGYAATRPLDDKVGFHPGNLPPGVPVRRLRGPRGLFAFRVTRKYIRLHLFPACGVPNILRLQLRLGGLFKIDLCLGTLRDCVIL